GSAAMSWPFDRMQELWRVADDCRQTVFAATQVIGCALVIAIATAANPSTGQAPAVDDGASGADPACQTKGASPQQFSTGERRRGRLYPARHHSLPGLVTPPLTGHALGMRLRRIGTGCRAARATTRPLHGLDCLNFLVANFQTGFGPFVSVYLTGAGWTQGAIGAALSAGTIASMVSQIPAGALVDGMRSKRLAAAGAIRARAVLVLAIVLRPNFLSINLAEV